MLIDELLPNGYYEAIPVAERNELRFGNIYKTHCYYSHENLQLWRPVIDPAEPTKTIATNFRIESAGQDAFKRTIPLGVPPLKTNEEFLVVRAKIRPAILLIPQFEIDDIRPLGSGGKIWRKRCLVGQIFGLADSQTKTIEFPEEFIDRIRSLMYPHLMFLPQQSNLFSVDSLLRLDECQSVFSPHLESTGYRLTPDLCDLLRSQMHFLFDGFDDGCFSTYRELINEN
jgi:hypothetical protein